MPDYFYLGRADGGRTVRGIMEAPELVSAARRLRGQGVVPLQIRRVPGLFAAWQRRTGRPKASASQLATLFRHLQQMLRAGLPLVTALRLKEADRSAPGVGVVLTEIRREVETGGSFAQALGTHLTGISPVLVEVIAAGEAGGYLDTVLARLADQGEKEERIRSRVRSQLTYPALVMGLSVIVTGFLVLYVLPQFSAIYADFQVELPPATLALLRASGWLGQFGPLLIGPVGLIVWSLWRWVQSVPGRRQVDFWLLRLPVFGPLLRARAAARAVRSLSGLLSSAVPVVAALNLAEGTLGNHHLAGELAAIRHAVQKGADLAATAKSSRELPPIIGEFIGVGQETGTVPEMLTRAADSLDEEVERSVERLTAMLEPLLTVCLTVFVGLTVIAVVSPIFSLWGQIQ